MTLDLYDALEICLQAHERGADIDACLQLFPDLAEELRPILETAAAVRAQPALEVPAATMRRGRARVLQHAAELREQKRGAFWSELWQKGHAFRVLGTSVATVVFLFSSGTGLVFASSNSLPGDHLYPVKRSWEDVQLAFIFDPQVKQERENEFEHERVEEIHELFSESRKILVDFQGKVEKQQPNQWQIAGLRIVLDEDVTMDPGILPGMFVRVIGETEDGEIEAEQIILLDASSAATSTPSIPTIQPSETKIPQKTPTPHNTETIQPHETEDELETPEPQKTSEKEPTRDKKDDKGGNNGKDDKGGDDSGGGGGDDGGGGSDD